MDAHTFISGVYSDNSEELNKAVVDSFFAVLNHNIGLCNTLEEKKNTLTQYCIATKTIVERNPEVLFFESLNYSEVSMNQ